jgi:ApaG protein
MEQWNPSYCETTRQVKISVLPQHLDEASDPATSVFAFSYRIRIENLGTGRVQLIERHWLIESNGTHFAEVVGPGVVGEQPTIEAGKSYEYASSAVINDPVGSMRGSYTFRAEDGVFFQAVIPRFDLVYPLAVH